MGEEPGLSPCSSVGDPLLLTSGRGHRQQAGQTVQGRRTEKGRKRWVLPMQQSSNNDKVKVYSNNE
jgi:hypothetical protein